MKFTSKEQYINYVKDAAIKIGNKYHYPVCLLISQACLENGFGLDPTCQSLVDHMNFLGMKAELLTDSWDKYSVWGGESFVKNTPEVYNGREVRIDDAFRIYDSVEQCFEDYCLFMKYGSNYGFGGTPKYGNKVLGVGDPETVITRVMNIGYCTGKTYASSNMRIIREWNLTQYDDPALVKTVSKTSTTKKTTTTSNVKKLVAPKFIDNRAASKSQVPAWRDKNDKKYIVVHYLGVVGQNFELWNNGYGATFTIAWNGDVYWTADYTAVTWQCGGSIQGESKDGDGVAPHRFYGKCTNYNSVSIENCIKRTDGKYEGDDNDDKWYFTEETQESLVWAVSKMMDDLNIPIDRVIRHFDVTGKTCPNPYVRENGKNGNWTWNQFKANLAQYRKDGTITIPSGTSTTNVATTPTTITTSKSYLAKGDSGDDVKTLQTMLNACGYNCGTVDGDFGSKTDAAVRALQSDTELSVDGMYGVKTKAVLEEMYKNVNAQKTDSTSEGAKVFLAAVKAVADYARTNGWTYGNSTTTPPCADKKISCDRLIARAMYDLGYTDQPKGGFVCGNVIDEHLLKWGFTKVTDKSKIKPGAVVAVKKKSQKYMNHVFVVKSYDPKTDKCDKFDMGSNTRIKTAQPFKNVKLVEWSDREFVCAWNVPENLKAKTTPKKDTSSTVYDGVDYSPVYNYSYYRKKYSDLQKAFGTDKEAYFKHFCQYGMNEGRKASSAFDVLKYKARYEDLRKAFGDNLPEYYKHYVIFGKKEGRKAL